MTTTITSQKQKAQEMLAAVAGGQTLFSHAPSGWCIVGPTSDIVAGATVTVTKKSGQTTDVVVDLVGASFEKQGVAYTVATFHNAPKAHTSTSHSHHHYATTSHAKTDHEDCLSLGCCGPTCAYHDTIHPGHQH